MKFTTNIAVADPVKSLARAIVAANSVLVPATGSPAVAAVAAKAAIPAYLARAASAAVLASGNTAGVLAGALFLNSPAYPAGTAIPAIPAKPATAAVAAVIAKPAVLAVLAVPGIKAFANCFTMLEIGADVKLICKIPFSARAFAETLDSSMAVRIATGSALLMPVTKAPTNPSEPSVTPSSLEKYIYNLCVTSGAKMSTVYENDNYFLKCEVTATGETIVSLLGEAVPVP